MLKVQITIILIAIALSSSGQTVKDIAGAKWFANNSDSSFFKHDTVRLIKFSHPDFDFQNGHESPSDYTNGKDYVQLTFEKGGGLAFEHGLVESWSIMRLGGKNTWQFDEVSKTLSLFLNRKPIGCFQIIRIRKVMVPNSFVTPKKLQTLELSLMRTGCGQQGLLRYGRRTH
jgi:hypothetical protein